MDQTIPALPGSSKDMLCLFRHGNLGGTAHRGGTAEVAILDAVNGTGSRSGNWSNLLQSW